MKFDYIKKGREKDMQDTINTNKDYYGKSVVDTAIYVMKQLMDKKITVKKAWQSGHKKHGGHSVMSAACVAIMIARMSPRGLEFEKWCIKNKTVMVDWKGGGK